MKPSRCTPPPWELWKEIKNMIWSILVQWISSVQNKTNKQPCFIDWWADCTSFSAMTLNPILTFFSCFWGDLVEDACKIHMWLCSGCFGIIKKLTHNFPIKLLLLDSSGSLLRILWLAVKVVIMQKIIWFSQIWLHIIRYECWKTHNPSIFLATYWNLPWNHIFLGRNLAKIH